MESMDIMRNGVYLYEKTCVYLTKSCLLYQMIHNWLFCRNAYHKFLPSYITLFRIYSKYLKITRFDY